MGRGTPRTAGGDVILAPIDRLEFLQGELARLAVGIAHVNAARQNVPNWSAD